jgi:hypothetical protein
MSGPYEAFRQEKPDPSQGVFRVAALLIGLRRCKCPCRDADLRDIPIGSGL